MHQRMPAAVVLAVVLVTVNVLMGDTPAEVHTGVSPSGDAPARSPHAVTDREQPGNPQPKPHSWPPSGRPTRARRP
jgi:hypothetical protein